MLLQHDDSTINIVLVLLLLLLLLHGFNHGQVLLNNLCDNFDTIAVQEHWLRLSDHDLNKFSLFRSDFQVLVCYD